MYSVNYKSILNSIISEMTTKPSFFVVQKSAFTRNRKLLAVDGTDVNIAYNPNSETYIKNNENRCKGYNQFHISAMYDILNKVYLDCIVQPRPKCNEMVACTEI